MLKANVSLVPSVVQFWKGPRSLPRALEPEWRLMVLRWLGILVVAPSLEMFHLPSDRLNAAYALLCFAAAFNAFVRATLPRYPQLYANGYLTTVGDAVLSMAMINLSGGFGSAWYFVLYTVTIASAMRYGYGPAAAASLGFVSFDLLQHLISNAALDGAFVIRSGFLLLTALLASYLRELTRHAESALAEKLREARYAALHDRLTDLPNRTLLGDRIDEALTELTATSAPAALLLVDLDHFKDVNDVFGHRFGDLVLQEVARRFAEHIPPNGTLARLSGDEFAVALPDAGAARAKRVATALLSALEQPLVVDELSIDVSASIGIAFAPEHGDEAGVLQSRAEVAMYIAKRRRNDFAVYTPAHDEHSRDRLELAADLRRVIVRQELQVHYQPIVSVKTGRIEELEALVRWHHPTRGLVSPGVFIPLAEETGMIVAIGRWVLEEACRQAAVWRRQYASARSLTISVNVSARQFQHVDVPSEVRDVLRETGLEARALKLEITESMAMADPELAIASLWMLKGMGIRLAIDDFGTGYSSLSYLKRFPADTLKIDKAFIDGLGANPEDGAIVAATIAFAKAVHLTTTAEGVEDEEQAALLCELGADRIQGFLCSRPLPAAEAGELLARSERLLPAALKRQPMAA